MLLAICIICLLIVNIIFAFINPDFRDKDTVTHCYTSDASKLCSDTMVSEEYTDATNNFLYLFYWGIGIQVLQLASLILVVCVYQRDLKDFEACKTVCLVIFLTSFLAGTFGWVIVGSIFRFRPSGETISTPPKGANYDLYMPKTGEFLKIWLIILYILCGLIFCCSAFII
jgi:hypothetical protein